VHAVTFCASEIGLLVRSASVMNRSFHTLLGVTVVLAILCTACSSGSSKPQASAPGQGFVSIPAPSTTAVDTTDVSSTAAPATSATAPASPTPTPLGTPNVQASAQANNCTVTPFATSGPPQVQAEVYPQWFGQGDLWFAPASIYAEFGIEQFATTSVWFQGISPAIVLANGDPQITGHLQDDATTTLTTSPGSSTLVGAVRPQEPVHGVDISLPKPGCWQLTITSGSQSLNVTLWAVPIGQRPDVASLLAVRAAQMPYPPPSTCPVTNWNGPSDHGTPFSADYWITGQSMNVDVGLPVFFATQSGYLDIYHDFPNPPSLTGQLTGNAAGVVRSSWIQRSTASSSNGWRGEVVFSTPGCWQLQVTDGSAKVDFTLYVYPADCLHDINKPKPASCKPPA
jgi:hypothetical protein